MESLICRASNVVISYGVVRGEAGTQEEKKQGSKSADKARVGEKTAAAAATSGSGRRYTLAPLPLPPARSLVPAPLRFLWFSNSGKNEEQGSSSGSSSGAPDGKKGGDGGNQKEGREQPGAVLAEEEEEDDVVVEEVEVRIEDGKTSLGLVEVEMEMELDIEREVLDGSAQLGNIQNGNAAKRWIQNLLNVNFMKKSPKIEVKVPPMKEREEIEDLPIDDGSVGLQSPKRSSGTSVTQQQAVVSAGKASVGAKETIKCVGCEAEIANSCVVDRAANPLSTLEVAHLNVSHDLESFSKFLHQVPLSELKIIAQTSHLSNLAYIIPEIQPGELARYHRLVFVTSSVEIKAKALSEEKAAAVAKGEAQRNETQSETKQEFYLNPATAYALAAAAASFLRSEKKDAEQNDTAEVPPVVSKNISDAHSTKPDDTILQEKFAYSSSRAIPSINGEASLEGLKSETTDSSDDLQLSDVASFMRPVTSVVSAKKETKQAMAKNLRSLHTCPCEWFACDAKGGRTRFFSIQGSESFASWQANLLFEPIQFEQSDLGVMVHRGIYEAAKGLYEQVLPYVLEHLEVHGDQARFQFTGHSLGGSLGMLLSLMLVIRGVIKKSALLPVYMFGSPYIMCGGDYLLKQLGLPMAHVQSIVMHKDIVPRTFACNYPDHVAEILRRVNGTFRDHICLVRQRLLYAPMGQLMILQPDHRQADHHPLLPTGSGLYLIRHRSHNEPNILGGDEDLPSREMQVRAAQRAFLNQPHPLEILSDPGAYGSEGLISKNHDPRSYSKAINSVLRQEMRAWRRVQRERRRQLWWPLISAESSQVVQRGAKLGVIKEQGASKGVTSQGMCGPSGVTHFVSDIAAGRATFPVTVSESCKGRFSRYKSLIASQHVQMGMILILSARMLIVEGLAVVLAWV